MPKRARSSPLWRGEGGAEGDAATALDLPEVPDMWNLGALPGGRISMARATVMELGVPIPDGAAAAGVAGAAQEQGQNSFSGQSDGAAAGVGAAAGAGWAAVAAAQELRQQGYTVSRDSAAVEAAAVGAAGAGWAAVAVAQELRQQGYTVSRDSAAAEAAAVGAAEEEKRSKLWKKVLEQERKRVLKCFDDGGHTFTEEMAVRVCEKHSLTQGDSPRAAVRSAIDGNHRKLCLVEPDAGGGAITMNNMGNGKPIFYCFACRVFFEGRKREHSSKQCHIDKYADYLAEKTAADNRQLAALCPRASAETTRTLRRQYTCNGCPRQFTSLTALMEHQILEGHMEAGMSSAVMNRAVQLGEAERRMSARAAAAAAAAAAPVRTQSPALPQSGSMVCLCWSGFVCCWCSRRRRRRRRWRLWCAHNHQPFHNQARWCVSVGQGLCAAGALAGGGGGGGGGGSGPSGGGGKEVAAS
eukprot:COSAG01_NODE_9439_length_2446_cov_29.363443_2_plen_469_part_00